MSYYIYYDYKFKIIMEELLLGHKHHDSRQDFAPLMGNASANKVARKRIIAIHQCTLPTRFISTKISTS
jgi:hypothetical protein